MSWGSMEKSINKENKQEQKRERPFFQETAEFNKRLTELRSANEYILRPIQICSIKLRNFSS